MAQKVHVLLVDDIDGGQADETVTFGLDGVTYEIDLNTDNANALRESMSRFVDKSRRPSGGRAASRGKARSGRVPSAGNTAEIREWAKANGHKVSERGRIPASVVEAFEQLKAS